MTEYDRKEKFVIFGSGALLLQGLSGENRFTEDIDVVKPPFDNEMMLISAKVGEKHGMDMGWLNTADLIFVNNFPKGWDTRTEVVFKGEALTVESLARIDLISTKFQALCDRAKRTDQADIEDLKPTIEEMEKAYQWLIKIKPELKDLADEHMDKFRKRKLEA